MHPHFPDDHGDGRVGGPFHSQKSIHKLLGGGKGMLLFFSFWTINLHHLNYYQGFYPESMWSWIALLASCSGGRSAVEGQELICRSPPWGYADMVPV